MNSTKNFVSNLVSHIQGRSLPIFRIILGLVYTFFFSRMILRGKFEAVFIDSQFHFAYDWLPSLPIFPAWLIWTLGVGLILSGILISLNQMVKLAFAFVFLVFGYFFFLEKALYNNHYFLLWLFSLIGFLIFPNSGSMDPRNSEAMELWKLWAFRAQIMMVYFFGGIAKFNSEWLSANTTRTLMEARFEKMHPELIQSLAFGMSYGGLLFDLLIPLLLLFKPTRVPAIVGVLIFNISNQIVFEIGVFPMVMISSLILFLDSGLSLKKIEKPNPKMIFICLYFLFLSIIPFRHLFYPGNVVWTEEGYFFSWRMISSFKKGNAMFRLQYKDGSNRIVDPKAELNPMQEHAMIRYPELAAQYSRHLRKKYRKSGEVPIVNAKIQVKMNKHAYQFVFDPLLDLGAQNLIPLKSNPHILPLKK